MSATVASRGELERLLRDLAPRALARLVRRHRDLEACEDAVQEACIAAARSWPRLGVPTEPGAWLLHVASRRLTDLLRQDTARRAREVAVSPDEELLAAGPDVPGASEGDELLELFLLCCHPALSTLSAIALTLRLVGGLTTAEIARASLVPEPTMAQRLTRARAAIRESGVSLERPGAVEATSRLPAVLRVLYLVFNEGYAATGGEEVLRAELTQTAIRLTRTLHRLVPDEAEVSGLLALMLLTEARREARTGPSGELVPLDEQDRTRWDRGLVLEGQALVERALAAGRAGPYQVQAAIAALHDEAASTDTTDWRQIDALYEVLHGMTANPLVLLNQAIAHAMVHGAGAGLRRLEQLDGEVRRLTGHRWFAVRAHLLERAGRAAEAVEHYTRAAGLTASVAERDHLLLRAARLEARRG